MVTAVCVGGGGARGHRWGLKAEVGVQSWGQGAEMRRVVRLHPTCSSGKPWSQVGQPFGPLRLVCRRWPTGSAGGVVVLLHV